MTGVIDTYASDPVHGKELPCEIMSHLTEPTRSVWPQATQELICCERRVAVPAVCWPENNHSLASLA